MVWRRPSTRWKPISSARAAPGPDAMRHGVIAGRAALLVALWAFLPAAPARAQGTQPLRKVELVRLLGSRAMSKAQVASLVRRNCVTFRPSERDRADLRAAGADDALFTVIDQCLRARAASRPTGPPGAARSEERRVGTERPAAGGPR